MKGVSPDRDPQVAPPREEAFGHADVPGTVVDAREIAGLQMVVDKLNAGEAYRVAIRRDGTETGYYIKEYSDEEKKKPIALRQPNNNDPVLRFEDEDGIRNLAQLSEDPKTFLEKLGLSDDRDRDEHGQMSA